ncbi:MAG: FecR domain-containing protein, partial [Nitrospirae bacterium]|nr:FecR domain-containing protein [Nitrospirota bacterium]
LLTIGTSAQAFAVEGIGTVVAIRNKAVIERDRKQADAKLKDSILLNDTVLTLEGSRAKMLFIDDSVLTMGEKSRIVIKEFVSGKDQEGKSVFNLIDGKMRSVVGRGGFEVHTPSAVAAARGTVILFETGIRDGRQFTTIICLEGTVNVVSSDPSIGGSVMLTPGMTTTVVQSETPAPAVTAPPADVERLRKDTDSGYHEISIPDPAQIEAGPALITPVEPPPTTVISNPIELQPATTTPVNINVNFP